MWVYGGGRPVRVSAGDVAQALPKGAALHHQPVGGKSQWVRRMREGTCSPPSCLSAAHTALLVINQLEASDNGLGG